MAALGNIDVPLAELLCETCRGSREAIREVYTPYILFDHHIQDDIQGTSINISIDVYNLTWQKKSEGHYTAQAVLSASCPGCEGLHALRYQLAAPIILLKNVGKCGVCASELTLENEEIELSSDNGDAPTLIIRADMICAACKLTVSKEDIIPFSGVSIEGRSEISLSFDEGKHQLELQDTRARSSSKEEGVENGIEAAIREKYASVLNERSSQEKGKALEDLLVQLLSTIKGFGILDRNVNTATEEIDIVVRNESMDPLWNKEGYFILVECKNWSAQRVGKNEFVLFKEKILNRSGRCRLGFLVCTGEFAQTAREESLRSSSTGVLIVLIDGTGLRQLVESNDRAKLLRHFVDRALLH